MNPPLSALPSDFPPALPNPDAGARPPMSAPSTETTPAAFESLLGEAAPHTPDPAMRQPSRDPAPARNGSGESERRDSQESGAATDAAAAAALAVPTLLPQPPPPPPPDRPTTRTGNETTAVSRNGIEFRALPKSPGLEGSASLTPTASVLPPSDEPSLGGNALLPTPAITSSRLPATPAMEPKTGKPSSSRSQDSTATLDTASPSSAGPGLLAARLGLEPARGTATAAVGVAFADVDRSLSMALEHGSVADVQGEVASGGSRPPVSAQGTVAPESRVVLEWEQPRGAGAVASALPAHASAGTETSRASPDTNPLPSPNSGPSPEAPRPIPGGVVGTEAPVSRAPSLPAAESSGLTVATSARGIESRPAIPVWENSMGRGPSRVAAPPSEEMRSDADPGTLALRLESRMVAAHAEPDRTHPDAPHGPPPSSQASTDAPASTVTNDSGVPPVPTTDGGVRSGEGAVRPDASVLKPGENPAALSTGKELPREGREGVVKTERRVGSLLERGVRGADSALDLVKGTKPLTSAGWILAGQRWEAFAHGTRDAEPRMSMESKAKTDEFAGSTLQELPASSSTPVREVRPPGGRFHPGALEHGMSPSGPNWEASSGAIDFPGAVVQDATPAEVDLRATVGNPGDRVHRLHELVTSEVRVLRRDRTDALDVMLRPDSQTEIALHVVRRGDGYVATARCHRGDADGLGAEWSRLQQSLALQGVRLEPLEIGNRPAPAASPNPAAAPSTGGSWAGAGDPGGRHGRGQSPGQPSGFSGGEAGFQPATPARMTTERPRKGSPSRLLESWA